MRRNPALICFLGLGLVVAVAAAGCGEVDDDTSSLEQDVTSDFLPYPWPAGQTFSVTQGNGGIWWTGASCVSGADHTGLGQFAWDWGMPTGTSILASKAGKVKLTQFLGTSDACFNGCGGCGFGCPFTCGGVDCTNRGNYVVIAHNDGTTQALYLHLSRVDVSVGASVAAGQRIGLSGTSGWSTGPHLHFMNENVGSSYYSQSISSSFQGTVPACHASSTSSNNGSSSTSPFCSSNCGGGGWWCGNDGSCIVNGVAGHNYHCASNNVPPDRDQACAAGCVIAASGAPDYCKTTGFCGSGAWCGNDCVGGFASTLYNFTTSGAVSSVTQCSVGFTNQRCVIATSGSPDFCN